MGERLFSGLDNYASANSPAGKKQLANVLNHCLLTLSVPVSNGYTRSRYVIVHQRSPGWTPACNRQDQS